MLKKIALSRKNCTNPSKPNHISLVWFRFYFKSQPNQTKSYVFFYLVVHMTL